jgi:integrase
MTRNAIAVASSATRQIKAPTSTPWAAATRAAAWRHANTRGLSLNGSPGTGLDPKLFGAHSLRRTKATLIYRRTGNLRAVQLLLGHTKIESTVRYLGIEVDDAIAIAEQVDVWCTWAEMG